MKKTVALYNGLKMPTLGFGVFQISDDKECEQAVLTALEVGYRLLDTAAAYRNEVAVGRAIKKSGIAREEIFVTTKLWVQDASYEKTKLAIDTSLKRLDLDYLDLYLIHQPLGDVYGAWRAMEEAYEAGKICAIGVSNFESDRLQDLMMHNRIKPMVNQIQVNPFYPQKEEVEWLLENEIVPEAWGPFAEGKDGIFINDLLVSIGKKYQKTAAQVMLRWLLDRDIVALTKSVTPERITANADIYDFTLSQDEIDSIFSLAKKESLFGTLRDPEVVKQLGSWKISF